MVDPVMKELPSECFSGSGDGYDALSFSQNLRLLNFLCDGALNAKTVRGWIEEQNKRVVQRKRREISKQSRWRRWLREPLQIMAVLSQFQSRTPLFHYSDVRLLKLTRRWSMLWP